MTHWEPTKKTEVRFVHDDFMSILPGIQHRKKFGNSWDRHGHSVVRQMERNIIPNSYVKKFHRFDVSLHFFGEFVTYCLRTWNIFRIISKFGLFYVFHETRSRANYQGDIHIIAKINLSPTTVSSSLVGWIGFTHLSHAWVNNLERSVKVRREVWRISCLKCSSRKHSLCYFHGEN